MRSRNACADDVDYNACTGDIVCTVCTGDVDYSACAGDVVCTVCTGVVDCSACTGEVVCNVCTGDVDWSACTGEVVSNICTGDVVHVSVRGASQDVPVRLMRHSLSMDATYVTMSSQKLVTISNRSDVIVHFRWTRFATPAAEQQHRAWCDWLCFFQ